MAPSLPAHFTKKFEAHRWAGNKFLTRLEPPLRHLDSVFAVAYSPNGKFIGTAAGTTQHGLWDATTGKEVGAPLAHLGPVQAVAFHRDGTTFVTASADGTARLWQRGHRSRIRHWDFRTWVQALAFTSNNRGLLIATCGTASAAYLADIPTSLRDWTVKPPTPAASPDSEPGDSWITAVGFGKAEQGTSAGDARWNDSPLDRGLRKIPAAHPFRTPNACGVWS